MRFAQNNEGEFSRMRIAFTNGLVITPNEKVRGGVIAENDRIVRVFEGELPEACDRVVDVAGSYIAPGFIDLHTHGGGGFDYTDATVEAYTTGARVHLKHGTTAMMPTITTCSHEVLTRSLNAYQAAEHEENMPMFIGAHLEGPYFSPEQAGAQDPEYIRNPNRAEYLPLLDEYPIIRRWSVAAELPGAVEMGLELSRRGVVASVGHSDAMYEDMRRAADYGYTLLTHFYSGMAGVRRVNAYRHSGAIESGYLIDDFAVEIIADGHHLPESLLKLIYKSKGSANICLVTDSVSGAGMPEGWRSKLCGVDFMIEGGVAKLLDRSAFAGSVTTANNLIRTMVEIAEVPICEAVKMLTLTPARIAGVADRMGSLVPGKLANIAVFDREYQVSHVMVSGKMCSEAL